jgi:GT2 family glycosyltransferase
MTDDPVPVPFLCGCFLAIRRRLFEEIGGFDEGFRHWGSEDAELCLRLWLLGYECRVVPSAEIAHLFREAFPYTVQPTSALHNTLRVATLHLDHRAIEVVIQHHGGLSTFGDAYAQLVTSNVWAQRDHWRSMRRFDGDWFIDRFGIDVLR